MGNKYSKKSSFQEHNWTKMETKGHKSVLYNDITKKSVEMHQSFLDWDEGETISMCKWRQNLPQNCGVVDLYEYGIKKGAFCQHECQLYVITERMHILDQIGTISKSEAFVILKDVVSGLKILFKKFGKFDPRPNIIGVNPEGRAKVWVNENFAKFTPVKSQVPTPDSQLTIVNNLIRILQSKCYADSTMPVDYPRNLNLDSTIAYIDRVCSEVRGFKVDRVYIDRGEFDKKYKQLREKQQNEEVSRHVAKQEELRLKQIEYLHHALRAQQNQLLRREQELRQQQQFIKRQQQAKMMMQLQRQQTFLQAQNKSYAQVQPTYYLHPEIVENSQGKQLKGTVSTNRSELYTPPVTRHEPPPVVSNQTLAKNTSLQSKPQSILPPQPAARPQSAYPHQFMPPKATLGRPPSQESRQFKKQQLRKQIEMIDSMILVEHEEQPDDLPRVESRILKYKA